MLITHPKSPTESSSVLINLMGKRQEGLTKKSEEEEDRFVVD
jgi:hypothetical protein